MRAALLVIGSIGCADIPKELGFDDGDLVTSLNRQTGAHIVTGPFYELEFGLPARPDSFAMPDRFTIGPDAGRDVLAEAVPDCAFEARIGLAFFPGLDITSIPGRLGADGVADVSTIEQKFEGPGAAQYEISYRALYTADTQQHQFEGTTTFTFFATGRINRHDDFTPIEETTASLPSSVSPFGCNTGGTDTFFLTSYSAFERTAALQVDRDGVEVMDGNPQGCTYYDSLKTLVAVAFPEPAQGEQFVRYRPGGFMTAGHVFDFVTDGGGGGVAELTNARRTLSSSMVVEGFLDGPADCGPALDQLTGGQLLINGAPFVVDPNGIFHEFDNMPHESTITLSAGARLPRGVAVILNVGSAKHVEVLKETDAGEPADPPAFVQQLDDQRILVVLRDDLLAGETVTIEPF